METFSALLAICAGNSPIPDVFFDLCLNKQVEKTIVRLVIWGAILPIMTVTVMTKLFFFFRNFAGHNAFNELSITR